VTISTPTLQAGKNKKSQELGVVLIYNFTNYISEYYIWLVPRFSLSLLQLLKAIMITGDTNGYAHWLFCSPQHGIQCRHDYNIDKHTERHMINNMKKIILVIAALICCNISGVSQQHFKFQGIPIDGTVSEFHNEIIKKGWKLQYDAKKKRYKKTDKDAAYDGTFMGKKAELAVITTNEKRIQACIVRFKEHLIGYDNVQSKLSDLDNRIRNKYKLIDNDSNVFTKAGITLYVIEENGDKVGMIVLSKLIVDDGAYKIQLTYGDLPNAFDERAKEDEDL
jgi:hypothetical protein